MSMYSMEDIARFAERDMTPEEQVLFEETLQSDTELRTNLAFYRNVHSSLKMKLGDGKDEDFKESLRRISDKHFNKEAKVIPMRRYIVWTSAIAAVFVLFLIWSPWHKDLYQQYSRTEMLVMTERSDSNGDKLILEAATAFNKEDFVKARGALKQIYDAEPDNTMAQYYYGITLLETGETQTSRKVLSRIYTGASIFKYDSAFYIALSYVKEKDNPKAIKWLNRIPADAANYNKSRELLKKIK